MTQLDKLIREKLLLDIENLINPLLGIKTPTGNNTTDKKKFLKLSLDLLPILAQQITFNLEFVNSIHKIKLDYYKRNLALLEILSEKQNPQNNLGLVFKVVRENISLKDISPDINIYHLYYTYRTKQLIQQSPRQFLLYEPEEYYQIRKLISSLNLE